jgi:UDPglucose 6-dehydrogenase
MAGRIVDACGGNIDGKTIAVLGVTFKPNTDDMRDSPSLDIIPQLQKAGATVRAFDPQGMNEAKTLLKDVEWCESAYDAIDGADALTIVTEWNEFRSLDLERVSNLLKKPIVVDLRNIYDPREMESLGFDYFSIGRPRVNGAAPGNQ